MAKYTLVVVDENQRNRTIIKVEDQKDKSVKEKVSLADIDKLTSGFSSKMDFMNYLNKEGKINFTQGNAYITTEYAGETYTFKCIYNSTLINECSKNVVDRKINHKNVRESIEFCNEVISKLENDKEYLEKLEETKYIKKSLKIQMLNYAALYRNNDKSEEELIQQNNLKTEICVELLMYKTFRGVYIFNEKTKTNEMQYRNRRPVPQQPVRRQPIVTPETIEEIFEKAQVDPNDLANLNYGDDEKEEFITPEEYEESYGKGGRHTR